MKIDSFKIKLLIAESEMSHSDLAEKCGINYANISTILYRGTCSVKNIGKIAHALGVPVSEIAVRE